MFAGVGDSVGKAILNDGGSAGRGLWKPTQTIYGKVAAADAARSIGCWVHTGLTAPPILINPSDPTAPSQGQASELFGDRLRMVPNPSPLLLAPAGFLCRP